MKIIFLGDCITTQQAGIHYYARNLIEQIVHQFPQHDYQVLLSEKLSDFVISQIVIPIRPNIPFHLRWRQLFTIPAVCNRLNPDLVIELAHFGPFNLKSTIKRVTVIHDLTPITHPQWHPISSTIMHRVLLKRIIRKASYIIANSDNTKATISKKYNKNRHQILVSYPHLSDLPTVSSGGISEKNDQKYFLTVGTIEPRKNQVTIIRAFDTFCQANKDYKLVIAGADGWKNHDFFNVLKKSPNRHRINLTGYLSRKELLKIYGGAVAFIYASYFEGFGVPILEASYFSLPLILARNESLPSWFAKAGLLFDPDNHLLLAKHMLGMVADESNQRFWSEKSALANLHFQQAKSDLNKIFN